MTDENLQNPFVLQCQNCNTIIADSFALVDYKDNKYFVGTMYSTLPGKKKTSTDDFDFECTYQTVLCKCSFIVGKKYLTVNEGLSRYAGKYAIDVDKVSCYGLGSTEIENVTMGEVVNEIRRLQRMCVFLYKRQDKNE